MASTINTNNIDTEYPIAGQDNDSQGFRDNFTNINTNFEAAKDEIEDLQSKAILKEALIGDTLDNDMDGALIKNAQVQGFRNTVLNHGSVSGNTPVDVSSAPYQQMTTTAAITLSFLNFSAAGTHSTVQLEIDISDVSHTVTIPAEVSVGNTTLQNVDSNVITFNSVGTYILEFSSTDNGASISVTDLTQARLANRQTLVAVPGSAQGSAGDLRGMIAADNSYIYVCTADYDGSSNIWIRAATTAW